MDEQALTVRHLQDLCRRSDRTGRWFYSGFLSLAEQDDWSRSPAAAETPWRFCGGHEAAERQLLAAGSESLCGESPDPPLSLVLLAPLSARFAEALSHRDFLGAVMNLGIERSMIGDLLVRDSSAYVFCLRSAEPLLLSLSRVRNTSVRAESIPLNSPDVQPTFQSLRLNVASERLDAVVAAFTGLSRGHAQALFPAEKVFVNSRVMPDRSRVLFPGDVLSVRGYGKAIYDGIQQESRKGRLFILLRRYV